MDKWNKIIDKLNWSYNSILYILENVLSGFLFLTFSKILLLLPVEGLAKFIQLAGLKCISNFEILKVKDGKEKVSKVSLKSLDNSSDISTEFLNG